ncbi:MAG: chromate resistance protein [Planctomycetes bacterium]|nr:chromate resistance protein [Planctomycetota bacterium]
MRWVTWQDVGVDRMGSAWLIRRHVDPEAEFAFVPAGQTPLPAGAEAFDIPGARYSHHRGHCTFHTLLRRFKLKDPVLERMARMIDEADTVQDAQVEPAAAGLDLICRGIRLISPDDATALERAAVAYDALYAALKAEMPPAPAPARRARPGKGVAP